MFVTAAIDVGRFAPRRRRLDTSDMWSSAPEWKE